MAELAVAVVFLCLTLLAVVVAVFTVAVSFLGRALQQARADQEDMAEKEKAGALARSEQLSKDIGEVRDKLKGEDADQAIHELKKKLRLYEKEKKEI
jgi:flagellar biosynthesis/type III secretory pathway M-ring protein FliF/YscJ